MFARYKKFRETRSKDAPSDNMTGGAENKSSCDDFYDQLVERYIVPSDRPIKEFSEAIPNYMHVLLLLPYEICQGEERILQSISDVINANEDGYLDIADALAETTFCDLTAKRLKRYQAMLYLCHYASEEGLDEEAILQSRHITDIVEMLGNEASFEENELKNKWQAFVLYLNIVVNLILVGNKFKSAVARSSELVKWAIDCLENVDEAIAGSSTFYNLSMDTYGNKEELDNLLNENIYTMDDILMSVWVMAISIIQLASTQADFQKIEEKDRLYKVLQPLTKSSNQLFRIVSITTFATMLNESEFAAMNFVDVSSDLVDMLTTNVKYGERTSDVGKNATTTTDAIRYIARTNEDKNKLVDLGVVPLLEELITNGSKEEKSAAANALWVLSFSEYAKTAIKKTGECVTVLKQLANSTDEFVKTNAIGALWEIYPDERPTHEKELPKVDTTENERQRRIFISYQHDYQPVVLKICEKLRDKGFHVWVDVDEMAGKAMMTAIADGIERADLVLICMSRSYKDSPSCRSEGEYTFAKQKPILPVMLERYYKPDGWLGLLVGATHYINFDGKFEFPEATLMMLRAIQTKLKPSSGKGQTDGELKTPKTHPSPPHNDDMSVEQVKQWVKDNNLECILDLLDGMDGKALKKLRKLNNKAPEYFCQTLQKEYNLKIKDVYRLFAAMDSLQ